MMIHAVAVMYQNRSQFPTFCSCTYKSFPQKYMLCHINSFMFPIFCQRRYLAFYRVGLSAVSMWVMYIALFFASDVKTSIKQNALTLPSDEEFGVHIYKAVTVSHGIILVLPTSWECEG